MLNTNNASSHVYFITNKSKFTIMLNHQRAGGMNAGWASTLAPGHETAILVNQKAFTLKCQLVQPGKVTNLNCQQVLQVCSAPKVTIPKNQAGTFWLTENQQPGAIVQQLNKRGFKLSS